MCLRWTGGEASDIHSEADRTRGWWGTCCYFKMHVQVIIREILQLLSPLPTFTPTYTNISPLTSSLLFDPRGLVLLPSKAHPFWLNSRLCSRSTPRGTFLYHNSSLVLILLTPSFLLTASSLENKKLKFLPSLEMFLLLMM